MVLKRLGIELKGGACLIWLFKRQPNVQRRYQDILRYRHNRVMIKVILLFMSVSLNTDDGSIYIHATNAVELFLCFL